ncbi:Galactosylgalactosylxylosylprotein 3-beta-glucuronosyltransferase 2 [Galemys pyrenaicus]|uniref:Galactosylgalactosylxylosylprotein 3-beta-glucuronosyltransferase n=1 Tax=Galemys pyrenaicus TaxID=202257 RepID=A0A8J6DG28_GALPY|nr:Galactosylgalactosylxylosylprotein 3-beta-glucuronosyltransferase 2 [Galemys pyrenaicus]
MASAAARERSWGHISGVPSRLSPPRLGCKEGQHPESVSRPRRCPQERSGGLTAGVPSPAASWDGSSSHSSERAWRDHRLPGARHNSRASNARLDCSRFPPAYQEWRTALARLPTLPVALPSLAPTPIPQTRAPIPAAPGPRSAPTHGERADHGFLRAGAAAVQTARWGPPAGPFQGRPRDQGERTMKSVLFSRFFILLPWILIVIIMLDVDTRRPAPQLTPRPYFSPYVVGRRGARIPLRRGGPDSGTRRCLEKRNESQSQPQSLPESSLPTIYAITPTYSRPVQKAELTRLANTFRQVAQLHWILVEDAAARSELVSRFLARAGLPSTHLHVPTPRRYKRPGLPRATEQRNAGLAWLRQRHQHQRAQPGVLFFADDDNTYSLELFQEVATGPPQLGG